MLFRGVSVALIDTLSQIFSHETKFPPGFDFICRMVYAFLHACKITDLVVEHIRCNLTTLPAEVSESGAKHVNRSGSSVKP